MRAAGYIRVSTAEQAMHGFSLDAQKELIERYAADHGMKLVQVYADEGKSASKALARRPELLRMVKDAESGQFDTILFKDLTRWSRNPSQFYAIQDRLDAAKVSWIAIEQPSLETQTAAGKFNVGIHISVAALESANTSERIKFVNASRVQKKYALTGSVPLGYKIEDKRVVIDEENAWIVNEIFDWYEVHQSTVGTIRHLRELGISMYESPVRRILRNTMYKGEYKGVKDYCPAYLSEERWNNIQRIADTRQYVAPKQKYHYIFSSLVKCAECGAAMTGMTYIGWKGRQYTYYKCKNRVYGCETKQISQESLEKYLLDNIEPTLSLYKIALKRKPVTSKKNKAALENKLPKLRELYIDGDISKEEYTARKAEIEKAIAEIVEPKEPPTLPEGWREIYDQSDNEAKRAAWRSIIKAIRIDKEGRIFIDLI